MLGVDFGGLASLLGPALRVLAQGGEGAPTSGGETPPAGGFLSLLPLFIGLYAVFYFLIIRPQRKQQREHEKLLADLRKNDTVRTSGGIFGKVVSIEPDKDQVVLEVDENRNVRLRVLRSSIVAVLDRENHKDDTPAAAAGRSR